ncbi:helix-turn-helix domain-containing protein [Hymenobacter glaciei]
MIPVGVEYTQFLSDLRAVIRHELDHSSVIAEPLASPRDELLTIREAAALLDVTVQTVHEWKRRGLLKYNKIASRSYIKRADVLSALQGHQRTSKTGKGGRRG